MDVLVVGGGGTVGSTVAYTLSVVNPSTNVVLTDSRSDVATGHSTDIRHSTRHVAHSVGLPDFHASLGSIRVEPPSPELATAADCIVVTASTVRLEGGDERGGRLTFLEQNLDIADEISDWLREGEPAPVIVVSNPVDRITYRLWERTGWPRHHFLGYSLSETARTADELARITNTPPEEVYCPVLGEHGEHIVPLFSRATVGGQPLEFSARERRDVIEYVRNIPYDVLRLREPRDSSRWVTGRGIVAVVQRLGDGGVESPVCLSTPLDGEYGFDNVCLSVPVRLDDCGINEIVEWSLSDAERSRLDRAYEAIRTTTI